MGQNKSKVETPYSDIKDKIRPFDLIFFKGAGRISEAILLMERIKLGKEKALFSHVAMIVTSDIIDNIGLEPGKLYLWESTFSGKLGDGINNINDSGYLGVQVREFDKVIDKYISSDKTNVAWAKLKNNPIDTMLMNDVKTKFGSIFNTYNGKMYDMNIVSLLSSLFPQLRCIRDKAEEKLKSQDWLFCSELCFTAYQCMGLFDKKFSPKDVVPVDFIEGVDEDGIPCIFENYIVIV